MTKRLSSLSYIARPLLLLFAGMILLSLGVVYLVVEIYRNAPLPAWIYFATLQFLPQWARAALFLALGLLAVVVSLWQLSDVVIIPINQQTLADGDFVVGYRSSGGPPRMVAMSGGAGLLILAGLGEQVKQLTGIIPLQDKVEYYYRASSLFAFRNVYYVVPTPGQVGLSAELSNGRSLAMKGEVIVHDPALAQQHVERLFLTSPGDGAAPDPATLPVSRLALEAIRDADVIVLGPGSLFESVLPNLLLPALSEAIRDSGARVIYVCNLMTEPGLTTGFDVADHVREIRRYGGFTPDFVLVNARRIDPEIRQIYEAANYQPVFLDPEAYEETAVLPSSQTRQKQVIVEGAVVVETDLAANMVQLTASLGDPGQSRAVRVLRHDPEKLRAALMALLQRG
jgi:2-phospho-L-lactate transferase/gluconeogenesis factor (CofD/UPF0052 family)